MIYRRKLLSGLSHFHTLHSQSQQNSQQGPGIQFRKLNDLQSVTELQMTYPTEIINHRKYQIRVASQSLSLNSLIILSRKLGKTTILLISIYNFQSPGKIVFISKDTDSIRLLSSFFSVEPLNSSNVQENQELWQKQQIIFIAPDLLYNYLENNQIESFNPKLIVFDDFDIENSCEKESFIISHIQEKKKCRIIGTSSIMPNDKEKIQTIITNMKAEQIIFIDTTHRNEEYEDVNQYLPKTVNFFSNDNDTESLLENFDKITQNYYDFLFDKGYIHSNHPKDFTNDDVFSALRECQSSGKKLTIDAQNAFNILLQLSSAREKLANYGPSQALAALESLSKKKQTEQRKKLLNSPQYKNFISLLDNSRDKLNPKFASLVKIIKDTFLHNENIQIGENDLGKESVAAKNERKIEVENIRIVVFANLKETCKCIISFLKEKIENNNFSGISIKPSVLGSKTKKNKLALFKSGQINVIATTYENLILVDNLDVTLYILFDQNNYEENSVGQFIFMNSTKSLVGKNVLALKPDSSFLDGQYSSIQMSDETREMLSKSKKIFHFWSGDDGDKSSEISAMNDESDNKIAAFSDNEFAQKIADIGSNEKSELSSPERLDAHVQGSELIFTQEKSLSQANFRKRNIDESQSEFARSQIIHLKNNLECEGNLQSSENSYSVDSIISNEKCSSKNFQNRSQIAHYAFSQLPSFTLNNCKESTKNAGIIDTQGLVTFSQSNKLLQNQESNEIIDLKEVLSSFKFKKHNRTSKLARGKVQEPNEIQVSKEIQNEIQEQREIQNEIKEQSENQVQSEIQNEIQEQNEIQNEIQGQNEIQNEIKEQSEIQGSNEIQNEIQGSNEVQNEIQGSNEVQNEIQRSNEIQNGIQEQINDQIEIQNEIHESNEIHELYEPQNDIQCGIEDQNKIQEPNGIQEQKGSQNQHEFESPYGNEQKEFLGSISTNSKNEIQSNQFFQPRNYILSNFYSQQTNIHGNAKTPLANNPLIYFSQSSNFPHTMCKAPITHPVANQSEGKSNNKELTEPQLVCINLEAPFPSSNAKQPTESLEIPAKEPGFEEIHQANHETAPHFLDDLSSADDEEEYMDTPSCNINFTTRNIDEQSNLSISKISTQGIGQRNIPNQPKLSFLSSESDNDASYSTLMSQEIVNVNQKSNSSEKGIHTINYSSKNLNSKNQGFLSDDSSSSQFVENENSSNFSCMNPGGENESNISPRMNAGNKKETNLLSTKNHIDNKSFLSDSFDEFDSSQIEYPIPHNENNIHENAKNTNNQSNEKPKIQPKFLHESDEDDFEFNEDEYQAISKPNKNNYVKQTSSNQPICQNAKFLSSTDDENYDFL